MRTAQLSLAVVVITLASSGCISLFPPAALDYGRGAQPLERGTLRLQAGGGGGISPLFVAGGGAVGGRAELQVTDHVSIAADGGAGIQLMPSFFVVPIGGHLSTQVNPGLDWLALRGSLGVGVDLQSGFEAPGVEVYPEPPPAEALPWLTAATAVVVGVPEQLFDTGAFEPYLSANLGLRRYVGAKGLTELLVDGSAGTYQAMYAGGLTLGSSWAMNETVSFYGAANATLGVVTTSAVFFDTTTVQPAPSASLQGGVAFQF